jgi:hypothetical protein
MELTPQVSGGVYPDVHAVIARAAGVSPGGLLPRKCSSHRPRTVSAPTSRNDPAVRRRPHSRGVCGGAGGHGQGAVE